MATPDKDLEAVREQYDAVAGSLSKLALVSLSTILLLVIPFARACRQISGEDANRRVQEINQLSHESRTCPRLSYVFLLFPAQPWCDNPYSGILNPASDGEEGTEDTVEEEKAQPNAAQPAGQQQPPEQQPTPDEAQRRAAAEAVKAQAERIQAEAKSKQRQLEDALDADARQFFTVKPSLLAADLEFDLRYWIFALPFVVGLSAVYFGILRMKLAVLLDVAAHRLAAAKDTDVTVLDTLSFARRGAARATPFLSYPGRLEAVVYVVSVALALAYLVASGAQFWRFWSPQVMFYLAEAILFISYFALVYTYSVGGAMDDQARGIMGVEPRDDIVERTWRRLKRLGRRAARLGRFRPRVSLLTGSLLVFSTLFLAFSSSCDDESGFVPRKGYELALGNEDIYWYSGFLGGFSAVFLGRWYYLACLVLALFALIVVAVGWARGPHLLRNTRAGGVAYRLSATLALFMLADVTFVSFFASIFFTFFEQPAAVDAVRVIAFVVPAVLWNFAAFSRQPGRRARWERWRNVIAALYLPGVALGIQEMYIYVRGGYTGVPVFFVGIVLLAFGFAEVYSRTFSAQDKADKASLERRELGRDVPGG